MPATLAKNSSDTVIAELAQLSIQPARRKFLAKHKTLIRQEFVEQLAQLVESLDRLRQSVQRITKKEE